MNTEIIPIDDHNLNMVAELLYDRSQTLKSYTVQKYESNNNERFRGVIATVEGKPIGCFGSIPKVLRISDGTMKNCGWFADWYVSPHGRGLKIGELLLNALSDHEQIMFGHPGPKRAQSICLSNGYDLIGFHSRRRLVLRPWVYQWKRGNLFSVLRSKLHKKTSKKPDMKDNEQNTVDMPDRVCEIIKSEPTAAKFVRNEDYENWVQTQPIANKYTRKSALWEGDGCSIIFFDEKITNGEKRRLILHMEGEGLLSIDAWTSFIIDTRKAKRDYIEIFTTNKRIDSIFQKMGAWKIEEAPIMVRGLDTRTLKFKIHPWDRENWTYLATEKE